MDVKLDGFDELVKTMLRLPMEEDDENTAVNAAARVVAKAITEEAPIGRSPAVDSSLHKNIKVTRAKNGVAKAHSGGAYHAHLIEFGRSGGEKTAKKKGKLQKVTWGDTVANPFFTRGYEKSKRDAQQKMADVLKKRLKL